MDIRRNAALLAVIALIATACGAAPLEPETTISQTSTTASGPEPVVMEPAERAALASAAIEDLDTFAFRIRVFVVADPDNEPVPFERVEITGEGAIDIERDRSRLRIDYGDVSFLGDDVPRFAEEIRVGDVRYERGYGSVTALVSDPNYESWYVSSDDGLGPENSLVGLVQGDEIAALIAAAESVEEVGRVDVNGVATSHLRATIARNSVADVGERYPNSIADLNLDSSGPPAEFAMWIDDEGLAHRVIVTVAVPFSGVSDYTVELELFDFGEPVDIEAPEDAIEAPDYLDDLLGASPTEIRAQEDGTMFRLNVRDGFDELQLTVEASGRVVAVTDTSIFATPNNYTTWQISLDGVEQLVALIEGSGLLDHPDANLQFGGDRSGAEPNAAIFYNDCCVLDVDALYTRNGYTDEQLASRIAFEELIAQLRDLSWLGTDVLTEPTPFVPEGVTLLAEPSTDERPPVQAWPLADGITALGEEPSGEIGWAGIPVCLYGDDAAAVFALTADSGGTNLTVRDDEGVWDLHLRAHLPGYRLYGDPCP